MPSTDDIAQPQVVEDRGAPIDGHTRIEELSTATEEEESEPSSDSEDDDGMNVHGWMGAKVPGKVPGKVPALYTTRPILKDELVTPTSIAQDKVVEEVLPFMSGKDPEILELNSHGLPALLRRKHIKFCQYGLGKFPSQFQAMDASRPWLLYWNLAAMSFLGEDLGRWRERVIQTFTPMQNPDGGFGGGHGQLSHCAASYAATLSLALVGGLGIVDRRTMWQWLGSVKQKDGGFAMAIGGEEDVRGAYCAMTIHSLLNLPMELPPNSPARVNGDETFLTNLGEWISSCQTYEGGIGSAPDNEAHGAYAFCSLACLCLMDAPHKSINKWLNVPNLLAWLSSRQQAPEGGFQGRTNKLVDACYSHWVGGCWALLEAAIAGPGKHENFSLCDREGLVRYTLCCSQQKKGGLRDKPSCRADGYHTCYSLAGLSAAQNQYYYEEKEEAVFSAGLTAAFNWRCAKATPEQRARLAFDEGDTVGLVHPVFVIPPEFVERTRKQFQDKVGF